LGNNLSLKLQYYRFKHAIFGIRPIPALFSQMISEVMRICEAKENALNYIDDMINFSRQYLNEHINAVLNTLTAFNL
jgi:non-ribosomal peptide synthetase component E (peptide arylation enzyme)